MDEASEHYAKLIEAGRLEAGGGDRSVAERHFMEAIAIGERQFGKEHPSLALALNELSRLYIRQSDFSRAEPVLERLLQIVRAKGDRHPDVATVLAGLAVARRGLGDDAAAEQLFRHSLQIREQVLAPNHMAIVITLEQLGETCATRANVAEALVHLERALMRRESTLGAEHATVRSLQARITELARRAAEPIAEVAERAAPLPAPVVERAPERVIEIAPEPAVALASSELPMPRPSRRLSKRHALAGAAVMVLAVAGLGFSSLAANESDHRDMQPAAESASADATPAAKADSHKTSGAVIVQAGAPSAMPSGTATGPIEKPVQPTSGSDTAPSAPKAPVAMSALRKLVIPKVAMPSLDSVLRGSGVGAREDAESIRKAGIQPTPATSEAATVTPPVLIGPAPTPRFPDELRAQPIDGEVLVQFRVNEKGRVDPASMQVLHSQHELFTAAVRNVLPRLRFEPARSGAPQSKPQSAWVQFRTQFTAGK